MKKEDQHRSRLGICRRIFNFIVNEVIVRGLKRLPLGSGLSRLNGEDKAHLRACGGLRDGPDSEAVRVHFKVTEDEELVDWSPLDYEVLNGGALVGEGGGSKPQLRRGKKVLIPLSSTAPIRSPSTDNKIREQNRFAERELAMENGRDSQAVETNLDPRTGPRRGGGSIKVSFKGEKAVKKGKDAVVVDETTRVEIEQQGEPRVRKPINLLAQNINDRSESFIKRREEIMRRQLSMELKENSLPNRELNER